MASGAKAFEPEPTGQCADWQGSGFLAAASSRGYQRRIADSSLAQLVVGELDEIGTDRHIEEASGRLIIARHSISARLQGHTSKLRQGTFPSSSLDDVLSKKQDE